jgi:hypothetical protein
VDVLLGCCCLAAAVLLHLKMTKLLTHVVVHHQSLLYEVLEYCSSTDVDAAVKMLAECVSRHVSVLSAGLVACCQQAWVCDVTSKWVSHSSRMWGCAELF